MLVWRLLILLNCFTEKNGEKIKTIRKNHIAKNEEKEGILCEAHAFYTVQGIL